MQNDLALRAVHDVRLLPREVVMVLDVEHDMSADLLRDAFVDERVVRGGVAAHEVHGGPVFLARFFLKGEPREVLQLLRQIIATIHRDAAVVLAHLRSRAARAAVAQQREVIARWQLKAALLQRGGLLRIHVKGTELDKGVSRAPRTDPVSLTHPSPPISFGQADQCSIRKRPPWSPSDPVRSAGLAASCRSCDGLRVIISRVLQARV